jgi:hypothetical protein
VSGDPNKPKRPLSSYFLYGASVRSQVQKELGTKVMGDVAKRISELWKEIDGRQRTTQDTYGEKEERRRAR